MWNAKCAKPCRLTLVSAYVSEDRKNERHATHLTENQVRLAEQTTAHASPLVISKSSSSWHASPNLPRARPDARDEDSGSKRLKFAETQVLPTDATVRADVNLSSGAGGAPETSDTNMAVESVLDGFEQARIAKPALNHISNVASDGSLKLLVSTEAKCQEGAIRLDEGWVNT